MLCGFAQTARIKFHRLGTEIIAIYFSRFWRLDVQDQGAGRAGLCEGLSPPLANSRLLPVSSGGFPSACVCVLNSSYEDTSHVGLRPSLVTSFYLSHPFKEPACTATS